MPRPVDSREPSDNQGHGGSVLRTQVGSSVDALLKKENPSQPYLTGSSDSRRNYLWGSRLQEMRWMIVGWKSWSWHSISKSIYMGLYNAFEYFSWVMKTWGSMEEPLFSGSTFGSDNNFLAGPILKTSTSLVWSLLIFMSATLTGILW